MTKKKVALITWVTYQEGSIFAKSLFEKGFERHCLKKYSIHCETSSIDLRNFRLAEYDRLSDHKYKARIKLKSCTKLPLKALIFKKIEEVFKISKKESLLKVKDFLYSSKE